MKILPFQHFISAVFLSLIVGMCPFFLFSGPTSLESGLSLRHILWFAPFGLVGLFWMFFEGKTPPQRFESWLLKILLGLFIWGPLYGLLTWNIPTLFKQQFAEGLDFGLILIFIHSLVVGFVLSLVLSIYSYFFIKS